MFSKIQSSIKEKLIIFKGKVIIKRQIKRITKEIIKGKIKVLIILILSPFILTLFLSFFSLSISYPGAINLIFYFPLYWTFKGIEYNLAPFFNSL